MFACEVLLGLAVRDTRQLTEKGRYFVDEIGKRRSFGSVRLHACMHTCALCTVALHTADYIALLSAQLYILWQCST